MMLTKWAQTRMAAYFVSMDIVLLGQYIYFYWKYHQSHEDTSEEVEPLLKNTRLR